MGYTIEVSFNILKHNMVTNMTETVKKIALEHSCSEVYDFCEMENETRHTRKINHTIISISFDNNSDNICSISNIVKFLQKLKRMRQYHIECIYTDDIPYNIIYASSHYLTMMEKDCAKDYMETDETKSQKHDSSISRQRRERGYSEEDIQIRKVVGVK